MGAGGGKVRQIEKGRRRIVALSKVLIAQQDDHAQMNVLLHQTEKGAAPV